MTKKLFQSVVRILIDELREQGDKHRLSMSDRASIAKYLSNVQEVAALAEAIHTATIGNVTPELLPSPQPLCDRF